MEQVVARALEIEGRGCFGEPGLRDDVRATRGHEKPIGHRRRHRRNAVELGVHRRVRGRQDLRIRSRQKKRRTLGQGVWQADVIACSFPVRREEKEKKQSERKEKRGNDGIALAAVIVVLSQLHSIRSWGARGGKSGRGLDLGVRLLHHRGEVLQIGHEQPHVPCLVRGPVARHPLHTRNSKPNKDAFEAQMDP